MADFKKVCMSHERWRAQWPAIRVREIPCALAGGTAAAREIACGPGGVARSLRCWTVSNAFVLLSPV